MHTKSFLKLPLAVMAAFALTFAVACDEAPTDVNGLSANPDVAFNTLGDTGIGGETNAVTPSTNADNKDNGWAHVTWNSYTAGVGEAPLKLTSTRDFDSCFEYRIDGEPSPYPGMDNDNEDITDGVWNYECGADTELELNLEAESYVEVRMVFGAERDERFDWTRFDVLSALNKDKCKDGQWQSMGFKNQGQCIRYVETGKDSRTFLGYGHAVADGTFGGGTDVIELEFEAIEAKNGLVGDVYYENHTDEWFFEGEVTCFASDGNRAIMGATSTSEDDSADAPDMLFYLEDNGEGVDRYRPLIGDTDCSDLDNDGNWYDVIEGSLTIN